MLQLYFSHKICRISDMFRSVLIIFRGLLNISKAYIKTWIVQDIKFYA
jgi:hypothetical protein